MVNLKTEQNEREPIDPLHSSVLNNTQSNENNLSSANNNAVNITPAQKPFSLNTEQKKATQPEHDTENILNGEEPGKITNKETTDLGYSNQISSTDKSDKEEKNVKSSIEKTDALSGSGVGNTLIKSVKKSIEETKQSGAEPGAGESATSTSMESGPTMSSHTGESKKGVNLGAWIKAAMVDQNEKQEEYEMDQNQQNSGMRPAAPT